MLAILMDVTAPQGLEPQIPVPETGVLPITPGRNAKVKNTYGLGESGQIAARVGDLFLGVGDVDAVREEAAGFG